MHPVDPRFWALENQHIWGDFNELVMDAMLQGASNALPLLPAALQPLVSWDIFNESALAFLRDYRGTLNGINATTQTAVNRAIDEWVRSGDKLDVLIETLTNMPQFSLVRAQAIAVTEVTRIFAEGNVLLWQSTGVVGGKRWMTAVDERVCPFCGPLHGQIVAIDSEFTLTPDQVAGSQQMRQLLGANYSQEVALQRARQMLGNVGSVARVPPYHVRCRCWLQPVVALASVEERIGSILAQEFFAEVKDNKNVTVI